jgi:hypothetical protein
VVKHSLFVWCSVVFHLELSTDTDITSQPFTSRPVRSASHDHCLGAVANSDCRRFRLVFVTTEPKNMVLLVLFIIASTFTLQAPPPFPPNTHLSLPLHQKPPTHIHPQNIPPLFHIYLIRQCHQRLSPPSHILLPLHLPHPLFPY